MQRSFWTKQHFQYSFTYREILNFFANYSVCVVDGMVIKTDCGDSWQKTGVFPCSSFNVVYHYRCMCCDNRIFTTKDEEREWQSKKWQFHAVMHLNLLIPTPPLYLFHFLFHFLFYFFYFTIHVTKPNIWAEEKMLQKKSCQEVFGETIGHIE